MRWRRPGRAHPHPRWLRWGSSPKRGQLPSVLIPRVGAGAAAAGDHRRRAAGLLGRAGPDRARAGRGRASEGQLTNADHRRARSLCGRDALAGSDWAFAAAREDVRDLEHAVLKYQGQPSGQAVTPAGNVADSRSGSQAADALNSRLCAAFAIPLHRSRTAPNGGAARVIEEQAESQKVTLSRPPHPPKTPSMNFEERKIKYAVICAHIRRFGVALGGRFWGRGFRTKHPC